jgi:hypothetical protein
VYVGSVPENVRLLPLGVTGPEIVFHAGLASVES